MLTSMTGFAVGDVLAQVFIQEKQPSAGGGGGGGGGFDVPRFLRLTSFGFFVHGSSSHWFYGHLDEFISGSSMVDVVSKVLIDQVFWNPCFSVMFFGYIGLLEMKGLRNVAGKFRNEFVTSVTGSWTVWPLAHLVNFRFVPVGYFTSTRSRLATTASSR